MRMEKGGENMRIGDLTVTITGRVKSFDDDYHELWVDVSTHGDKSNNITRFVGAYSGNEKIEVLEPREGV